ncbi:hypothetical protein BDF19DRAFT_416077 [Syncephalis fuscata]|nr:hypothetical protein BDF19DRAFT_416077 [Syncephalis fuscata]
MTLVDTIQSFFYHKDGSSTDDTMREHGKRLAEMVANAKEQMIRAYGRSAEELGRLAQDLEEAERRADAIRRRGKTRVEVDRDWSAGYFHGKLDQATGRPRQTLDQIYATSRENPDWAIGYFRGRLDEARDISETAFNRARENGWQMAESLWSSTQDAASYLKDKGQSIVWSGKEWVTAQIDDNGSDKYEAATTDKDLLKIPGQGWLNHIYSEIKSAAVERAKYNREQTREHAQEVEDMAESILHETNHLGDKLAHIAGEVKSHLNHMITGDSSEIDNEPSPRFGEQMSKTAEKIKDRATLKAGQVYDDVTHVKDEATNLFESMTDNNWYLNKDKYHNMQDYVQSFKDSMLDSTSENVKDRLEYEARHLRDKSHAMLSDAKDTMQEMYINYVIRSLIVTQRSKLKMNLIAVLPMPAIRRSQWQRKQSTALKRMQRMQTQA